MIRPAKKERMLEEARKKKPRHKPDDYKEVIAELSDKGYTASDMVCFFDGYGVDLTRSQLNYYITKNSL